ncbi:DUF1996 domain-containing protein [Nonomuraea zeae]|uniref:DUF1996 domain-containing protein n=2 Tax=Nonomuraea zeae TaxID=1642303 RepID=A0A5S4GNP0_9ACTN|nr:DUF1996 domain-containing protein [Nonomuraea zeae]
MSALAVAAGGLVSAAVIGAGPARADHCDPAQATASPSASPSASPTAQQRRNRNGQQDQNDQQNQDQNQDQQQDQQVPEEQNTGQQQDDQQTGQQQDDQQTGDQQDQTGQGGGAAVLDPAQDPEAEETASTFSRRGRQTRTPTPSPSASQTQNPDDDATGQPSQSASPTGSASPSASPTATGEHDECLDLGPFVEDFVSIRDVQPVQLDARAGRNGSRGSFVSQCGTNRNGHNNPDNFIVAPGVSNGAHHLHDYVGNLSTDGFSTDESLAAAGTTCRQGDKSTYFWPVLRDRKVDVNTEDPDGNVGQVLRARSVTLQFRGNATSRVVAMPRFIRIITGDAKAATNGTANARAGWSCSGFQNRISPDKYTLCPRGSQVLRILDFPSCWDGQNTDSANHRTHVVFPGQGGACPQGTRAIPALRMTLAYSVPQGPSYAVDAFPEQKHNPVTDHADFANVMPDRLMQFVVSCINRGRRC